MHAKKIIQNENHKKVIKMVLKHERCLISLILGEMQIKTTMRDHFSPIGLAKTWKLDNILLGKLWGNIMSPILGGMWFATTFMETNLAISNKLHI